MRAFMALLLFSAALSGCQQSVTSPTGAEQQTYTCPMRPEIRLADEGKCSICKMNLVLTNSDDHP